MSDTCKHGVNKINICTDCLHEKYSPRESSLAAPTGYAALVKYWTERRTRKLHDAKVAASVGDYATALKETAEADATLLCLQDLHTEMPHSIYSKP